MCRYIEGNHCSLGKYCHCHPVREQKDDAILYDDGFYSEQDDTLYLPMRLVDDYSKLYC